MMKSSSSVSGGLAVALAATLLVANPAAANQQASFSFTEDFNTSPRISNAFSLDSSSAEVGNRFYFIDFSSNADLNSGSEIKYLQDGQVFDLELPDSMVDPSYLFSLGEELIVRDYAQTWALESSGEWRIINTPWITANNLASQVPAYEVELDGPNRLFYTGNDENNYFNIYYLEEGASAPVKFFTDNETIRLSEGFYQTSTNELAIGVREGMSPKTNRTLLVDPTASSASVVASQYAPGEAILGAWGAIGSGFSYGLFIETENSKVTPRPVDVSAGAVRYSDNTEVDDVTEWVFTEDMLIFVSSSGVLYSIDKFGTLTDLNMVVVNQRAISPIVVPDENGDDAYVVAGVVDNSGKISWWSAPIQNTGGLIPTQTLGAFQKFGELSGYESEYLDPYDDGVSLVRLGVFGDRVVYLDDSNGSIELRSHNFTGSPDSHGNPMDGDTIGTNVQDLRFVKDGSTEGLYFNEFTSAGTFRFQKFTSDQGFIRSPENFNYRLMDAFFRDGNFFSWVKDLDDQPRSYIFAGDTNEGEYDLYFRESEKVLISSISYFDSKLWISTVSDLRILDLATKTAQSASTLYPDIDWSSFTDVGLGQSLDNELLFAESGGVLSTVFINESAELELRTRNVTNFTNPAGIGENIIYGSSPIKMLSATNPSSPLQTIDSQAIADHGLQQAFIADNAIFISSQNNYFESALGYLDPETLAYTSVDLGDYEFTASNKRLIASEEAVFVVGKHKVSNRVTWLKIDRDGVQKLGWPEQANQFVNGNSATYGNDKIYFAAHHKDFGSNLFILDLSPLESSTPSFSAPPLFQGPVITSAELVGTNVVIGGSNLELISSLSLGDNELSVEIDDNQLKADASGVPAGEYLMSYNFNGSNVSTEYSIVFGNLFAESQETKFWTKQISPNEIKLYAKNIVGKGKIQFFHNGNEVAWVNASDNTDPKLRLISSGPMAGSNYLVRTRELVSGKNVFEVYLDGERVLRRAQGY